MLGTRIRSRASNVYIALRLTTASLLRLFKSNEFVAAALACIRGNSKLAVCIHTRSHSLIIIKNRKVESSAGVAKKYKNSTFWHSLGEW
jgi:hypothetical protein